MTKSVNLVLILLVLGFLCSQGTVAQTTEITYQGSLKVSGLPANANYDFEFRLFDSLAGGTQVGSLIPQSTIAVTDGVFSVRLDFGQNFPSADRYLEIAVRPAGAGGFTFLNPRQKITSAPYAIRSLTAGSATTAVNASNSLNLGGVSAATYVVTSDARLSDARNPTAGSANYIQNTSSPQASSNFNISGTGNANTFNATTRYNFAGIHLISALGLNNVFVGAGSGLLNTGNYNAFVGGLAGFENKGGSNNSFFGAEAGKNNSFGNNNSFFGAYAGNATTTGSDNSFFGHRSGLANTAGINNSFFGTYSGIFNTTGSDNSFYGNSTGFNSNGDRNSFFGSQAGNLNGSGSDNSFLGSFAGRANTTGSNNAFVGASSGSQNATGVNNAFFGTNSGFTNTASNNSFYGFDSGYFNNSGANNSFFGVAAGRGNTSGELNVFIGVNAGNNNSIGSSNTIIGSEADVLSGNLTYATAIGAESVVTTSNTVVLGRPVDSVRVPGNLNVLGTFTAANLSISASNITGVIGTANGGTGLALAGTTGNFLRSNGTIWTSSPFTVADIPVGSSSYIQNTSVQQGTSNFNVSGNGTAGGTLSGNVVNAVSQYNINGVRVLSNSGLGNLFAGSVAGAGNTTGASNAFFGSSAGALNSSGSSNSFLGSSAGSNTSSGPNNTFVGASSGLGNSTGANNSYFGVNAGQMNTIGSNNTLVGSNSNVGSNNLTYATAVGSDAVVSTNNTVVLGRTADTVRVPGNLNVVGTLTAGAFSIPAINLTGQVAVANGGTGLSASGVDGNFLRSNGSAWTSSAIAPGDLPAGNGNYIQNGVGLQATSNFNISGNGTVGGLFSAGTVNATTQYNFGGTRVFMANGVNNVFVGSGTATSGDNNSFVGANAASSNTTGTSNTIIGSGANVGAGNLIFATALGSGALVNNNNSVVLGRAADTVRVPGNLTVTGTFTAVSFPAANISGILAPLNGGTGVNSSGSAGNVLRSNGTTWASAALVATDIPSLAATYVQNTSIAQVGANFNIGGSGSIGGSLTVGGSITGTFTVPAANITGILAPLNGGTGVNFSGSAGNVLRSNGTIWASSPLVAADIPSLAANYVQNTSISQSGASFNVGGTGTVGGLFSANTVSSATQYNIGGNRVLTTMGTNNVFVGADTGTTGSSNTFVGDNAGATNTTGSSNTLLGASANVGSGTLTFATAIGSGAVVNNNDSVVLGRVADTVRVPGNLTVTGTFTAASFTLPATNITGILAPLNGGTGVTSSGSAGNVLRSNGTTWASAPLAAADIPSLAANYVQNTSIAQAGANFNVGGSGTIGGSLTVGGSITGTFSVPAGNITGVLVPLNGGTGVNSSGTAGNVLRSNGTIWASSALVATDIPSLAANYVQNGTGAQAGANFNVGGNGTIGGNLLVGGSITGTFSVPATNITGILIPLNGGTGVNSSGLAGNVLRSNGTTWASAPLVAADIPSLAANYVQNGTGAQAGANFNIGGSGTIGGSLTVGGSITGTFSVAAGNITGILAPLSGGTGVNSSGLAGNVLRSNGTVWASSPLVATDIPNLAATYVQNTSIAQAGANFNVGGTGTVGGLFSANTVNATLQYNIGGTRVFTTSGTSNVFAGAGTATTGSNNSFFGSNAGAANLSGTSNTMIGSSANLAAGGLSNSTAIGANASVAQSDSLVLGSINGVNGATANTSVGIGTTTPKAPLDVRNGHIYVGSPGQGIILKSPTTNICKILSIDDAGVMVFASTTCP